MHDNWSRVDQALGSRVARFFGNIHNRSDISKIFSDVGNRIEKNTKLIESLIRSDCNPPQDVLKKLPAGHLFGDQSFSYIEKGYEISSEDVSLAIEFAIRYIYKLEKINLLPDIDLKLENGIKFK